MKIIERIDNYLSEGKMTYDDIYKTINQIIGSNSSSIIAKSLSEIPNFTIADVKREVEKRFGPNITGEVVELFKKKMVSEMQMPMDGMRISTAKNKIKYIFKRRNLTCKVNWNLGKQRFDIDFPGSSPYESDFVGKKEVKEIEGELNKLSKSTGFELEYNW